MKAMFQNGGFGRFNIATDFASIGDNPHYRAALAALANFPERSLLTASARAYLYFLVRAMDCRNVLEVGTYLAGTTELLARAITENGPGRIVTLDPATASDQVIKAIASWPTAMREATSFKAISSGDFFYLGSLHDRGEFDLILVDGNHVYDYALFDLTLSAQRISPSGVLVVDNAEVPGVFYALRTFLAANQSWRLLGASEPGFTLDDPERIITTGRGAPLYTAFLLAPSGVDIGDQFREFSFMDVRARRLDGIELQFGAADYAGELQIHVKLTSSFGRADIPPFWSVTNKSLQISRGDLVLVVPLSMEAPQNPSVVFQHVDVGLLWSGAPSTLHLATKPKLVTSSPVAPAR
jgi:predicted O-methyltransferase YrrM